MQLRPLKKAEAETHRVNKTEGFEDGSMVTASMDGLKV